MQTLPSSTGLAPGWYDDPWWDGDLRWWDGVRWTGHVAKQSDRDPEHTLPFRLAGLGVLAMTALVVVFHAIGELLVDSSLAPWLSILLIYSGFFSAMFAISRAMVKAGGYSSVRDALGWKARLSDVGWGTVTWLVTLASNALLLVIIHLTGIPFTSNVSGGSGGFHRDGAVLAAFGLVAIVGAPLFEELFFRGALLRALRSKLGPAPAIILQGLAFGAYHMSPSLGRGSIGLAIVLSGVGIILGIAAYRWGRLGPGMIAHMIVNILAVTVTVFSR